MKIKAPKLNIRKNYITDENGNKTAVIIPIKEYERLVQSFEDNRDIKTANNIMNRNPKFVKYNPSDYK